MKLTFEGTSYEEILTQIAQVLTVAVKQSKNISPGMSEKANITAIPSEPPVSKAQGPGPETIASPPETIASPVETPADNPVEKTTKKTGKVRTAKQLENDERLRKLAVEKAAKKTKPAEPETAAPDLFSEPPTALDPAEVVRIRQKTIEDLQTAYADGHQEEVFALLSKHGNGAKSFRELPPEAFVPIRKAIDAGALS